MPRKNKLIKKHSQPALSEVDESGVVAGQERGLQAYSTGANGTQRCFKLSLTRACLCRLCGHEPALLSECFL